MKASGQPHFARAHARSSLTVNPSILVTGSAGFIGKRALQRLSGTGHNLVAMYHERLPDSLPGIFPTACDMSSSDLLATPLRGVSTVVHLAWSLEHHNPKTEDLPFDHKTPFVDLPLNVQKTLNLIKAMELAGTKRLVFISPLATSPKGKIRFLREKYWSEFFILNSKIPEKIILRLPAVFGNGEINDRASQSVLRMMNFPALYPIPKEKIHIPFLHVEDAATIIANSCFTQFQETNIVLSYPSNEPLNFSELFRSMTKSLGKPNKLPVSGPLGSLITSFLEKKINQDPVNISLQNLLVLSQPKEKSSQKDDSTIFLELIPEPQISYKDLFRP